MSNAPLTHTYPMWESPEDEPWAEPVEVWRGKARIVRNRRRMRKLKRRGVPLMDTRAFTFAGYVGHKCWLWFIERTPEEIDALNRKLEAEAVL